MVHVPRSQQQHNNHNHTSLGIMYFLRLFLNVMSLDGESEYLGSEREIAIKYACRTLEVVYMYLHTLLQYYAFAQSASHLS